MVYPPPPPTQTPAMPGQPPAPGIDYQPSPDDQYSMPAEDAPLLATHLDLSDIEEGRLADRCLSDYERDIAMHDQQMEHFAEWFWMWRTDVGGPGGATGKSNYKVDVLGWNVFSKLANLADLLFGDGREVVGEAVSPNDVETTQKVGLYMTWLVFMRMKIMEPLMTLLFRVLMFGRAFVMIPYVKDSYFDADGREQVEYKGPKFIPLMPDDLIFPNERVTNLHEFSHMTRQYYETPDELLAGEDEGRYKPGSVTGNWAKIYNTAFPQNNEHYKPVTTATDTIVGVNYRGGAAKGTLHILEWYGRWRMPRDLSQSPELDDWDNREMREVEVVFRLVKDLRISLGCQMTAKLYPRMKNPRPFDEVALVANGEYWCKSYPEIIKSTADELTVNNNLRTEAGEVTVGAPLAVKRGLGQQFLENKWKPRMVIEVDNPGQDVQPIQIRADLAYTVTQEQALLGYIERLTGISDQTLGRSIDRPNAPRTARGQLALISKGDVRQNLDNLVIKEHLARILQRIWQVDSTYADPSVFFRVTESSAKGLFDEKTGFGEMTAAERGGQYDFQIKFATSSLSREAEREKALMMTQLALSTPLGMNDPRLQWNLINEVFKKNDYVDLKTICPEPPPLDTPQSPDEEWSRMLQGLPVHVHWMDQDDQHLAEHFNQGREMEASKNPDPDALGRLAFHMRQHEQQQAQKQAMALQAMAQQAVVGAVADRLGVDPQIVQQQLGQGQPQQQQQAQAPQGMPQMTNLSGGGPQLGAPDLTNSLGGMG